MTNVRLSIGTPTGIHEAPPPPSYLPHLPSFPPEMHKNPPSIARFQNQRLREKASGHSASSPTAHARPEQERLNQQIHPTSHMR